MFPQNLLCDFSSSVGRQIEVEDIVTPQLVLRYRAYMAPYAADRDTAALAAYGEVKWNCN